MCLLISPSVQVQYFILEMDVAFLQIVKHPQAWRMGNFVLFLFVPDDRGNLKYKSVNMQYMHLTVLDLTSLQSSRQKLNIQIGRHIDSVLFSLWFNAPFALTWKNKSEI